MDPFQEMRAGLADNSALKAQLDAQVGFLGALSLRTVDTMQRVHALNLQLARQLVDDGFATCREVLACEDPAQAAAVAMRHLGPGGEHMRRYQHALFALLADSQAGLPATVAAAARAPASTRERAQATG